METSFLCLFTATWKLISSQVHAKTTVELDNNYIIIIIIIIIIILYPSYFNELELLLSIHVCQTRAIGEMFQSQGSSSVTKLVFSFHNNSSLFNPLPWASTTLWYFKLLWCAWYVWFGCTEGFLMWSYTDGCIYCTFLYCMYVMLNVQYHNFKCWHSLAGSP